MEKDMANVPFFVHESDMARADKVNRRCFITIILLIAALIFSWAGFLLYESQMETVSEEIQEVWQDTDRGSNSFVGGDYYGATEDQDN